MTGSVVVIGACGGGAREAVGVSQKVGRAGCVSATGTRGVCARASALVTPGSAVVSTDGKNVYVESEDRYRGGVAIFDRAADGTLTQKAGRAGCVSESLRRMCRHASGLRSARDLAVSPDGRSVYVAAASGAIAIFDRDRKSGTLTQKRGRAGCVSRPAKASACTRGRGLAHPTTIAVSADGTSVYVTSFDDEALAIFDRDPRSGALTQKRGSAGCIADGHSDAIGCRHAALDIGLEGRALTVSPDGKHVYAGTGLQIFDRRPNGELTPNAAGSASTADQEVLSATISADGKNVYATASFDGLFIFDRDARDGALTLKPGTGGCFAAERIEGCTRATALAAPTGASLSPGGRDLYVASGVNQGNALVIFDRDPSTGTLTQKPGPAGCVSQSGTGGRCGHGHGLREANTAGEGSPGDSLVNPTLRVTVSPNGRSVYLAGDTVAVFDRP